MRNPPYLQALRILPVMPIPPNPLKWLLHHDCISTGLVTSTQHRLDYAMVECRRSGVPSPKLQPARQTAELLILCAVNLILCYLVCQYTLMPVYMCD